MDGDNWTFGTQKQTAETFRFVALVLSCILAFCIRLFSVVLTEPIIHEFDPHFNWRCTTYISEHGVVDFMGWFDNISWYPQGRPVGDTSYPGMMIMSAWLHRVLKLLHFNVDLMTVCVYTGPVTAVLTVLLCFQYGRLLHSSGLGVMMGAVISFVPGLISRSMAGGYDYECCALFVLILCIYSFSAAVQNGSILASILSGLAFAGMAWSWGGYVFVANCIPLYVAGMLVLGRFSYRLYIAYSIWAVLGLILCSLVPFISEKAFTKPEHFAMLGVLVVIQLWAGIRWLKAHLSEGSFSRMVFRGLAVTPFVLVGAVVLLLSFGLAGGFAGRLLLMFDPSYATKHVAIIASVAEHQPSTWGMFYMDCGLLLAVFPVGCFWAVMGPISQKSRRGEHFLLVMVFAISTLWFASIMVRLVLVFTPAMAIVTAYAIHKLLRRASRSGLVKVVVSFGCVFLLCSALLHGVWFACYSYSGDHLHFQVIGSNGQAEESDDYREAYRWLARNTRPEEKVLSWWDYGYQLSSPTLAEKGCMADGNTNNFTHIGIIGMTMSSPEGVSWRLARMLDASYMLVIFGGASGYGGDDINKFLWMPRIANQTFHNISGDMYVPERSGGYGSIVGPGTTHNMSLSALYHFCYNQFERFHFPQFASQRSFDYNRRLVVEQSAPLSLFQEAFTSKHWIVRLYRVLPDPQWERIYPGPNG